jgi:hypothetical protein
MFPRKNRSTGAGVSLVRHITYLAVVIKGNGHLKWISFDNFFQTPVELIP